MRQSLPPQAFFIAASLLEGPVAAAAVRATLGYGAAVWCLDVNPLATRHDLAQRLLSNGVAGVGAERIVTPASAAAWLLSRLGCRAALVVGSQTLCDELTDSGIDARAGADNDTDAVVVGAGGQPSMETLRVAADRVLAGARFVALDRERRVGMGLKWDFGPGAVTAMLRYATAVTPTVVGYPQPTLFEAALAQMAPGTQAAVVVAQPTPACVEAAHRAGLPVLAIGSPGDASDAPSGAGPVDGSLSSLSELPALARAGLPPPPIPSPVPAEVAPCVGAVIMDASRRVLWIRRRDSGLWALPTGHLEPGERWVEALLREVREETGLSLSGPRLIGIYSDPRTQIVAYPDGRVGHFVTAVFTLRTRVTGSASLRLARAEITAAEFRPQTLPPSPRVHGHERWIARALSGCNVPEVD